MFYISKRFLGIPRALLALSALRSSPLKWMWTLGRRVPLPFCSSLDGAKQTVVSTEAAAAAAAAAMPDVEDDDQSKRYEGNRLSHPEEEATPCLVCEEYHLTSRRISPPPSLCFRAVQTLFEACQQTRNDELIANAKEATEQAISDSKKVTLLRFLLHNHKNKEDGGSGTWMLPIWPDDPVDEAFLKGEFTVLLLFICGLIQASGKCFSLGNSISTVLIFCLNTMLSNSIPCIIIYQRISAILGMVYIVTCCLSDADLDKKRLLLYRVAHPPDRDCPSAEWTEAESRDKDGPHPHTTKTPRSRKEEAAFVKHMLEVFAAIFCPGAAQVAVLTQWLARANAFGRASLSIRFLEICAALGSKAYESPEVMYWALFVLRHDPSAYKAAAHLFIGCFFGLMVSVLFFYVTVFDIALAQLSPSEHLDSFFSASGMATGRD